MAAREPNFCKSRQGDGDKTIFAETADKRYKNVYVQIQIYALYVYKYVYTPLAFRVKSIVNTFKQNSTRRAENCWYEKWKVRRKSWYLRLEGPEKMRPTPICVAQKNWEEKMATRARGLAEWTVRKIKASRKIMLLIWIEFVWRRQEGRKLKCVSRPNNYLSIVLGKL